MVRLPFCNFALIPQGARGEIGKKGERGDPGLPVSQVNVFNINKMWAPFLCLVHVKVLVFCKAVFPNKLAHFFHLVFLYGGYYLLLFMH